MRQVVCVLVASLILAVPVVGVEPPAVPQQLGNVPLQPAAPENPHLADYHPPVANGPVAVLVDENVAPLFPLLTNDTGREPGTIAREDRDVFAGVEAIRVTPLQKYHPGLPQWRFKIVEKPENPGEFRYIRFAWKKTDGSGIMMQFHSIEAGNWERRYVAGQNTQGWQSTILSPELPSEWQLITRDLFKEFGAFTLSGIAFTVMEGESGLFDHIMLGRSVEDLDKATETALGRTKNAKPLGDKERDTLWTDLVEKDGTKAEQALRRFLETASAHTEFIRTRLKDQKAGASAENIAKLIADLDADDFETRNNATKELTKIGADAIETVREAGQNSTNAEVRYRTSVILKRLGANDTPSGTGPVRHTARLSRVIRVLERADTPAARELLKDIADGKLAPAVALDAKAALGRLAK